MKKTIIALATVSCMLTACVTTDAPRRQIEKHLGVSSKGKRALDEYVFDFTAGAPDMMLVRHELLKHGDMRNLTVGLLMMPWSDELDVEMITANIRTDDLKQVLDDNLTESGSTLVRSENITNITATTDANGRIVGTFNWVVPDLFRGRASFVAKGNKLEYLGVLRKHPVGKYDCVTIFSRKGDIFTSQQWIQTEYFAVIESISETTKAISRSEQISRLQKLMIPRGITSVHWPIRKDTLPLVYSGEREDRDKVIAILKDSKDWSVTMSGRAVGHIFEEPLQVSIEKQIKGIANKKPRQAP